MVGVDISESQVSPGNPRVDGWEEIHRVKRKLALEQAKFERELAELRTGLVSVKELQIKEFILWFAALVVFCVLIYLIYFLYHAKQYLWGSIVTFFLISYVVVFIALHDAGIRKIILSTKDVKIEKIIVLRDWGALQNRQYVLREHKFDCQDILADDWEIANFD